MVDFRGHHVIAESLNFIRDQLDSHIKSLAELSSITTLLSPIFGADGQNLLGSARLGMALVNIEEERVNASQLREARQEGGVTIFLPPEVRLNLHVLVVANTNAPGSNYEQALKSLSAAISFFQGNRVFAQEEYPGLPVSVEKLVIELETLDYEFQNHVWGTLGGKLLPSVMYRIRLVALQLGKATHSGKPIIQKENRLPS